MKGILEIRKLFWLIHSVLLIILVFIVVGFIPGDYALLNTFAYSVPIKGEEVIILNNNSKPPVNHKIIVERNIFGSSGSSPARENQQREKMDALASVTGAQLRLRATIAGDDQVACAVIENLKSKVQDIYKAGDIIEGAKIESINRNKIVLVYGNKREVLSLHIAREALGSVEKNAEPVIAQRQNATESVKIVSPIERDISQKACVTQVRGMEAFLEKMEVAPYIVNGEEKGLCITGLDNLSMAGYFGFENGDIIQTINGQMLTDKQKAFQVLKKARSQSLLNFQLLRNQHKMDLSFEIK